MGHRTEFLDSIKNYEKFMGINPDTVRTTERGSSNEIQYYVKSPKPKSTSEFLSLITQGRYLTTFEHTEFVRNQQPVILTCVMHGHYGALPVRLYKGTHECPRCHPAAAQKHRSYAQDMLNIALQWTPK